MTGYTSLWEMHWFEIIFSNVLVIYYHCSTLAWQIPWTEEPARLQSMGSLGVRHDWVTSLSLFTFMHWRRKWQPTPVFLPGESQGRGSLVGCSPWGRWESGTTEWLHFHAWEKAVATHSSVLAWRIQGRGSLVGCCLWGHTELDTADVT